MAIEMGENRFGEPRLVRELTPEDVQVIAGILRAEVVGSHAVHALDFDLSFDGYELETGATLRQGQADVIRLYDYALVSEHPGQLLFVAPTHKMPTGTFIETISATHTGIEKETQPAHIFGPGVIKAADKAYQAMKADMARDGIFVE